jgi:hypothetical protein
MSRFLCATNRLMIAQITPAAITATAAEPNTILVLRGIDPSGS